MKSSVVSCGGKSYATVGSPAVSMSARRAYNPKIRLISCGIKKRYRIIIAGCVVITLKNERNTFLERSRDGMSKAIQARFYSIMGCYLDDERLAAHAINEFLKTIETPEQIYRDLLATKYHRWMDQLEQVADETLWKTLNEWCKDKQAQLDCFGGDFWGCGDNALIEKAGWKLTKAEEADEFINDL